MLGMEQRIRSTVTPMMADQNTASRSSLESVVDTRHERRLRVVGDEVGSQKRLPSMEEDIARDRLGDDFCLAESWSSPLGFDVDLDSCLVLQV